MDQKKLDDWWKTFFEFQLDLSALAAMFNACTEAQWNKARDEKDFKAMGDILQKAWDNAPDKPWIRDLPGWFELCDLCADYVFGDWEL